MIVALLFSVFCVAISFWIIKQLDKQHKLEISDLNIKIDTLTRQVAKEEQIKTNMLQMLQLSQSKVEDLQKDLIQEQHHSATILSQKKSSETKLGQISENLIPFLEGFPYDPKAAHFLGNPIDYVVFDLASSNPAVVFLEIKTGNSKLSNNQKHIKQLINDGKVRFEEIRLSEKGLKHKGNTSE